MPGGFGRSCGFHPDLNEDGGAYLDGGVCVCVSLCVCMCFRGQAGKWFADYEHQLFKDHRTKEAISVIAPPQSHILFHLAYQIYC